MSFGCPTHGVAPSARSARSQAARRWVTGTILPQIKRMLSSFAFATHTCTPTQTCMYMYEQRLLVFLPQWNVVPFLLTNTHTWRRTILQVPAIRYQLKWIVLRVALPVMVLHLKNMTDHSERGPRGVTRGRSNRFLIVGRRAHFKYALMTRALRLLMTTFFDAVGIVALSAGFRRRTTNCRLLRSRRYVRKRWLQFSCWLSHVYRRMGLVVLHD